MMNTDKIKQTDLKYENYIFDLYGTLIDIHTDQKDAALWKSMANLYARAGADFSSPEEMRCAYEDLCAEKQVKLRADRNIQFEEIDIGDVFRDLYEAASVHHDARLSFGESSLPMIAETFRAMSMRRFGLYPGTIPALQRIKASGARLFLLSNAQRLFTWSELEMTGLLPYFDAVYISSDYGIRKPEPAFMEILLQEQGLKRETCVMTGNEIGSDIAVAAACGMDSVYLNTGKYAVPQVKRDLEWLAEKYGRKQRTQIIWSGDLREIC